MTNAIGAGQASVVALAHPGLPKRGAAAKADAKPAHDSAEVTKDLPHQTLRHDEADASSVKSAEKPTRRDHGGGEKKSDDHDNSFEATIDGIDRATPQNTAGAAGKAADWNAMLVLGQMILDRPQKSSGGKSDGHTAATNVGAVPASAKLLKQESATALLLAKQRLLAGNTPVEASAGQSTDEDVASPIIVRSRETHWSFADPKTSSSLHATPVSTGDSAAANPLASFTATGAAKNHDGASAISSDTMTSVLAESSPLGATRDAPDQQSFSDKRDTGSGQRDRTSNSLKGHTGLEILTSKSIDKAAEDDTGPTGGISNAAQQVRNGVLSALTGDPGEASQANAAQPLQNRPMVPGQVVRTIELTLAPADLGSVTLRLSLKSNVLTVEAEASKASTAKLLSDDRDALEKSLRDAGYDVSTLKITDAGASSATATTAAAPTGGMQFQDNGQARMGFAQRQDGDLQRRDGSTPDQPQQRSRSNNPQNSAATDAANSRQTNAIYI
jgi:hypothetical protein